MMLLMFVFQDHSDQEKKMTIIFYITSKAFRVFPLQRPSSTLFQSYKDLVYKKISRNSNDLEPYFFFLTDSSYFFF